MPRSQCLPHGLGAPPTRLCVCTAPRALKRATAQEAALASLKTRLAKAEGEAAEQSRMLALTQKQLATQTERRRVAEMGGKSAQRQLATVQIDQGRTVAREAALDSMNAMPPASLDEAVLATETKRSAPKQIYDPSVERKKPQHGSSSSRKRSRTPTPVGGIIPNTEGRPPKRSAAAAMERTVLNRA